LLGRSEIAGDASVLTRLRVAAIQFVEVDLAQMVSAAAINKFNL